MITILSGHNLDDDALSFGTMSGCTANEIEEARMVEVVDGVARVGEEDGVRSIAFLVVFLPNLHHRILLVLET